MHGFVARPIGAAIFGHYGDRIGRKAALIATLLLTGLATVLVALVPTYQQIGIWGAIILILLRFIQGVGVGGEWGAVASCVGNADDASGSVTMIVSGGEVHRCLRGECLAEALPSIDLAHSDLA